MPPRDTFDFVGGTATRLRPKDPATGLLGHDETGIGTVSKAVAQALLGALQVGIGEAPLDGTPYVRKDAAWAAGIGYSGRTGLLDVVPGAAPTAVEGRIFYDSTRKSLAYVTDQLTTAIAIGHALVLRGRNNTGATITRGKVVRITGVIAQTPTVALADSAAFATALVAGIMMADLANDATGYVMASGVMAGGDTSALAEGAVLFLGTAGAITATAPPIRIPLGRCLYSHVNNGEISVNIQRFHALDIPYDNTVSGLTARNVQAAIDELAARP